jgi:serine/threonine-protein kinase
MGDVYAARDTRLDRRVAVKVLRPSLASDPTFHERFQREARTTSSLSHPNICALFDVGEQDGIAYLVMEYLAGETLAARLSRGVPEIAEALDWAIQCADGLAAAHAAGVLHRDLKPGNIILAGDHVKLLDFGLARRIEMAPNEVTAAAISQPGLVAGTVAYMSPEQARGQPLDYRSDIFSFGIVLYEMLAGVRPFTGQHEWTILQKIAEVDPPPIHVHRPALPAAMESLVRQLLAKSPEERPRSMADIAERLRQVRRGSLRAPVWAPLRSRISRRLPTRQGLVLVAAALITVAALAWGVYPRTGSTPVAPAVPQTAFDWARLGYAHLSRYDRTENIDKAVDAFQNATRLEPDNAYAHAGLAEAFLRKDAYQPDPQWVRQATEAARRAVQINPDLAAAQAAHGAVLIRGREDEKGIAALKRALDLDPRHVQARLTLGTRHVARSEYAEAEAIFREAAALAPESWQPQQHIGRALYARARYQDATVAWEGALRLAPDNPMVLRNLGAAYHMLDRPEEAASALQRALEIQPTATVYSNLGTIRFFQGRFSDAAAAFERAVELNPTYYLYWGNLGDAYRWVEGARERAQQAYATAIARIADDLKRSPTDPDLVTRRALYLAKSGDAGAAAAAIDAWARLPRQTAASHFRVAVVQELGGARDQALSSLAAALDGGYAATEIAGEPELARLRADPRYHRLVTRHQAGKAPAAK